MIDTGANDGQSQRGIHGGIKGQGLHGDVTLVMVHAHEDIGCLPFPGQKGGVGRQRTLDVDALCPGVFDGRLDNPLFLIVSEETLFPGMRV